VQTLRLLGTQTSPYVRRVRIVAAELGIEVELVETADDAGQSTLRAFNPLWKVPSAEIEGHQLFDSRVINAYLLRHEGPGPLATLDPDELEAMNFLTVIDGCLDALINVLYLGRDGLGPAQAGYIEKQRARSFAGMAWIAEQVDALATDSLASTRFGLLHIALATTLEWMHFRGTYPVERHPNLVAFMTQHGDRPSLVATRPPDYAGYPS